MSETGRWERWRSGAEISKQYLCGDLVGIRKIEQKYPRWAEIAKTGAKDEDQTSSKDAEAHSAGQANRS